MATWQYVPQFRNGHRSVPETIRTQFPWVQEEIGKACLKAQTAAIAQILKLYPGIHDLHFEFTNFRIESQTNNEDVLADVIGTIMYPAAPGYTRAPTCFSFDTSDMEFFKRVAKEAFKNHFKPAYHIPSVNLGIIEHVVSYEIPRPSRVPPLTRPAPPPAPLPLLPPPPPAAPPPPPPPTIHMDVKLPLCFGSGAKAEDVVVYEVPLCSDSGAKAEDVVVSAEEDVKLPPAAKFKTHIHALYLIEGREVKVIDLSDDDEQPPPEKRRRVTYDAADPLRCYPREHTPASE